MPLAAPPQRVMISGRPGRRADRAAGRRPGDKRRAMYRSMMHRPAAGERIQRPHADALRPAVDGRCAAAIPASSPTSLAAGSWSSSSTGITIPTASGGAWSRRAGGVLQEESGDRSGLRDPAAAARTRGAGRARRCAARRSRASRGHGGRIDLGRRAGSQRRQHRAALAPRRGRPEDDGRSLERRHAMDAGLGRLDRRRLTRRRARGPAAGADADSAARRPRPRRSRDAARPPG